MPPSALDRQCPSFVFLLEAELIGGATFVKNWATSASLPVADQPPLRPVAGFSSSLAQEKNHIFVWHLAWFIFFFIYSTLNSPLLGPVE